ncbi:uncharacterized protein K460DRAFT_410013 [Cucurbitaria berberidis CBS 394.84]|uniref:SRR1-like domain-containing protein n=1 Tax=Cucurbitaria berberidis CBS 394.84 TaxID=1168544 RepID=A0A9P4L5T8_9PLEO|nr:uncharacterized protein K460DRAFT_410013 [Cucurbitaria berberidis CBS 394.84]KAF1842614.1 hypothetical protein K460DRAFT_410013 [Cucurbitaria berberidis CBS 394.84]
MSNPVGWGSFVARINGPPVFTPAFFRNWMAASALLNSGPLNQAQIKTLDADGNEHIIPVQGANKEFVLLSYHQWLLPHYCDLSSRRILQPACSPEFRGMILGVKERQDIVLPEDCCRFNGNRQLFENERAAWRASTFCTLLTDHIRQNGPRMRTVNEILCFGFGPLKLSQQQGYSDANSFLRHVVALEIRDVLKEVQPVRETSSDYLLKEEITVGVQDSDYCEECKSILKSYNITVYDTPIGFHRINKNSLIMSKTQRLPVRQIVADMTHTQGGPAGMLCNSIQDDGVEGCKDHRRSDPSSPRLFQFKLKRGVSAEKFSSNTVVGQDRFGRVFGECVLYLNPKD